jgi:phosphoglycolate phosphatase
VIRNKVKAVIFDLDGTLIDSAQGIAEILNEFRNQRGLNSLEIAKYRDLVALGPNELIAAALEIATNETHYDLTRFRERYKNKKSSKNQIYPGVLDALEELSVLGFKMAICSNKPDELCKKIITDLGLQDFFVMVSGATNSENLKPNVTRVHEILLELKTEPQCTVFVGDSRIDQQTARKCNLPFGFFAGGYDSHVEICKDDFIFFYFNQLREKLLG